MTFKVGRLLFKPEGTLVETDSDGRPVGGRWGEGGVDSVE